MSAKAISEHSGKALLTKFLPANSPGSQLRSAPVFPDTKWDELTQKHPWLLTEVRFVDGDELCV